MATTEPQPARPPARTAGLVAALLGIAIVGVSFLPALAGGRGRWTTERAREYQDASMQIQRLTHQLGSESPDTVNRTQDVEFKKALDHFQDMQQELTSARSDRGLLKVALRVCGGALGVAGIAFYLASKRDHATTV